MAEALETIGGGRSVSSVALDGSMAHPPPRELARADQLLDDVEHGAAGRERRVTRVMLDAAGCAPGSG